MPCSEYLRIVDLGQLVSFTASATCTKGEITARFESVVMVKFSKNITHTARILIDTAISLLSILLFYVNTMIRLINS